MTGDRNKEAADPAAALLDVDRASYELRRGRLVLIKDAAGQAVLVVSAETATAASIERMSALTGVDPDLAITHNRAKTLKVRLYTDDIVLVPFPSRMTAELARSIADPTSDLAHPLRGPFKAKRDPVSTASVAAVQLAKIARLLPSVVLSAVPAEKAKNLADKTIAMVNADDVLSYELGTAGELRQVTAARVPMEYAENTRILAFRSPSTLR